MDPWEVQSATRTYQRQFRLWRRICNYCMDGREASLARARQCCRGVWLPPSRRHPVTEIRSGKFVIRSPPELTVPAPRRGPARARAWRGLQIRLVRQTMTGNELNSDDDWRNRLRHTQISETDQSHNQVRPSVRDRVESRVNALLPISHHHQKCRTSAVLRLVDHHMVAPNTRRGARSLF
jgi:hypothetical protein